jgi:hypothetical protein
LYLHIIIVFPAKQLVFNGQNRKKKGKIDTTITQIHDCPLSWLDTGT